MTLYRSTVELVPMRFWVAWMFISLSASVEIVALLEAVNCSAVLDFHRGCRFRLSVGDGAIDGQHERASASVAVLAAKLRSRPSIVPPSTITSAVAFETATPAPNQMPPTNSCSDSALPNLLPHPMRRPLPRPICRVPGWWSFRVERALGLSNICGQEWDGDQAAADVIQVACREQADVARDERGMALVGKESALLNRP